ncbi:MAG TPA: serine hydrolase domain-containing protein [Nocardioides sp.]|uniref:serine hydrolase domain-containing protein n=1 Tax=Nocardioides sp. TaxID=35761 RepID=UPI002D7F424B|nr:serine hydrolase domain-containing protein [Nocardioides sp.]HET6652010.1 serine hydrolase domain-containing protein [Nocardioides sp.]
MPALLDTTARKLHRIALDKQVKGRVPGLYAGVVRDGGFVWQEGIGAADITAPMVPPSADDQYLVASNSKTFTAVLVMQLRDEGKLSLDDTLEQHVAEVTHPGVTIRQALAHVTGMQREPVGDIWETLQNPDRAELVAGFNEAERVHRPHHLFHYSNLVFSMLGEVVARLDGREWYDALKARILDPLEMRRTTVGPSGSAVTGYYVPPHTDVPVLEPVLDFKALAACGGLASTADDMARWSTFVADPVSDVLAPDTLAEMCEPQIMIDRERWTGAFGLGFMLLRSGTRTYVGHTGGMPGHITGLFTHRESKTGGLVLMNTTSAPDPATFAIELADHVIEHDPVEPEPWRPGPSVPDELADLVGIWYSEGSPFVFSVKQGRLEARAQALPEHKPSSLFEKVGDDLYRTVQGRETGELLRVTRDADGRVTKMNWATYLVTREPLAFGEWL